MRRLRRAFLGIFAIGAVALGTGAQIRAAEVVQNLAPSSSNGPRAAAAKTVTSKSVAPTGGQHSTNAGVRAASAAPSAPQAPAAPTAAHSTEVLAHGLWVWRTNSHLNAGPNSPLLSTCRTAGVNEVYLAVDKKILADARLPKLVRSATLAGMKVFALMGDATWYQPQAQSHMISLIDTVAAYNAKYPDSRFVGIHFDIEPHQLPQNKGSRAYLPALADTLAVGRTRAAKYGMDAAADLARFAIDDSPSTRKAFQNAVPRLFLMLYELKDKTTAGLLSAATSTINNEYLPEPGFGVLVVGVSVDDYPNVAVNLNALNTTKPGGAHYGGWAIHDETRYTARLAQRGQ